MRQVLLRFPFDQPWDFGPLGQWPGFGFGLVLLAWVLVGGWSLRSLWSRRGHWTGDDWSSIGLWFAIALAIIWAPVFGPKFAPQGLPIYGYGMMLLIGFGSGALLAVWRARREGLNPDLIWDLAMWLFIPGLIGARVFYLVQYGHQVFAGKRGPELLWAAINLPDGGLVLFGGLLAGTVSYFVFCQRRQVQPLLLADIVTPSVFLGIGFGRIGCLLNGCCFGDRCNLPWGLSFPHDSVPFRVLVDRGFLAPDAPFTPPLHPTQIYSAIDGFLICAITLAYFPYRQRNGSVFGIALLIYPTTRFLVELLRGDEFGQFGTSLTISQWVSIGIILCGVVYNLVLWRLPVRGAFDKDHCYSGVRYFRSRRPVGVPVPSPSICRIQSATIPSRNGNPRMSGTRATFPQSVRPEATAAPDSGESLGTFPPAASSEMTATVETTCDQELIESSLSGSSEAFGALVRRYQHRLYHSLVHMLGSSEDAQDVAQDAFVQAFQKLGTFRGQSGFYSWLYRIAMNAAISSRRKPRRPTVSVEAMREQSGEEPADQRGSSAPAHAMEVAERQRVVRSALAALSEEFRTCVVLKEMDGLSYEEIAGILDCPIGTVRSRIHRGRLELREKLRSFLAAGTE